MGLDGTLPRSDLRPLRRAPRVSVARGIATAQNYSSLPSRIRTDSAAKVRAIAEYLKHASDTGYVAKDRVTGLRYNGDYTLRDEQVHQDSGGNYQISLDAMQRLVLGNIHKGAQRTLLRTLRKSREYEAFQDALHRYRGSFEEFCTWVQRYVSDLPMPAHAHNLVSAHLQFINYVRRDLASDIALESPGTYDYLRRMGLNNTATLDALIYTHPNRDIIASYLTPTRPKDSVQLPCFGAASRPNSPHSFLSIMMPTPYHDIDQPYYSPVTYYTPGNNRVICWSSGVHISDAPCEMQSDGVAVLGPLTQRQPSLCWNTTDISLGQLPQAALTETRPKVLSGLLAPNRHVLALTQHSIDAQDELLLALSQLRRDLSHWKQDLRAQVQRRCRLRDLMRLSCGATANLFDANSYYLLYAGVSGVLRDLRRLEARAHELGLACWTHLQRAESPRHKDQVLASYDLELEEVFREFDSLARDIPGMLAFQARLNP